MPFRNREKAAQLLAERLRDYADESPLVLAIPRGAAPMARILADELQGEMDVILVHKLGAPGNPEYALGSVDETGHIYLSEAAKGMGFNEASLAQEKQSQMETLRQRRSLYTPVRPPINPKDRVVIVVDDGIATGATMIAALRAVREKSPKKLIAATAVASSDAIKKIAQEADEVVCLEIPPIFYAVGEFFQDFSQVTDDEVVALLTTKEQKTS